MSEILLDPKVSLQSKTDYTIVSTEVEFLSLFDKRKNLLIRGERLCRWAETFYIGRKREVSTYLPLYEELTELVPSLSDSDAKKIVEELVKINFVPESPLTISKVLQSRFPHNLWVSRPSLTHSGEWLCWLVSEKPDEQYAALVNTQLNSWFTLAEESIKKIYQITNSDEAIEVLEGWLGIKKNEWTFFEEKFPISVPEELIGTAREKWVPLIISTDGQFFQELDVNRIPFSLLQLAAKETFGYLKQYPGKIRNFHYTQLVDYLEPSESKWLSHNKKPSTPNTLPKNPDEVIGWYIEEYLPFREWQHSTQSIEDKPLVLDFARKFALWYLEEYPRGLLDGPISDYISFRRVRELTPQNDELLIIIVMDGLHCIDARTLRQLLLLKIPECQIVDTNYVFSPIPTITEDAKEALLRAVPPENIRDVGFVGEVLQRNKSLADHIRSVRPPATLFWRLTEPDSTYHRINKFETLQHDIKGSLTAAVDKIHEIIQSIPSDVKFQLIITSDHGRMLGESNYILPVPEGFVGHGRVAKGESRVTFPASGVIVKDNVSFLSRERFGTKHDLAIPLGEDAFQITVEVPKRELYSHGGLFPEEVIIPWYVFMKPEVKPNVSIILTGKGQSRKRATAKIVIINSSNMSITLERIIIDYHAIERIEHDNHIEIPPLSQNEISIEFSSWPTQNDKKDLLAIASIRSPYGIIHEFDIEKSFQSEDIYSTTDILEELQ